MGGAASHLLDAWAVDQGSGRTAPRARSPPDQKLVCRLQVLLGSGDENG